MSFSCPAEEMEEPAGVLGKSSSQLFVDLYKAGSGREGNYLVSPYSIFSGLSLLHLGANGSTLDSLNSLLHLNESNNVHEEARSLLDIFNSLTIATNSSFTFLSSNNVFLDESVSVKASYAEKVKCFYESKVTRLQMRGNPEESAEEINRWVEERTRGKIQKLVQSSSLRNAQAVLVNSLYFKAPWALPFKYTRKANFSQESGEVMEVDMMLLEGRLSTGLVDGVRVVQLDYNTCLKCDHSDMAMFIFVPEDGVSLGEAEEIVMKSKVLSGEGLSLVQERVRLLLPRFEVRHKSELLFDLLQLGLPVRGEYTGIAQHNLQVDQVLHEAVLRVDEAGSEGAAATAIMMSRMLFVPKTTIRADRTFFFSVVHKPSRLAAFAGKVDQPDPIKLVEGTQEEDEEEETAPKK